jgi:thiol-disulfide isomerase/thioredoxin
VRFSSGHCDNSGAPFGNRLSAASAAVVAAALAVSIGGCGQPGGKNSSGLGRATVIAAGKRVAFPQLSGPTLDGSTLNLASYKGQVVVVNIWGSWCPSCEDEAPALEKTYEAYRDKGVAFVGIDTRDNVGQAKAFVKSSRILYPNLVDGDSENLLTQLVGLVPLQGVPTTLMIDRNGKVAWSASMGLDDKVLSGGLDSVLAENVSA